MMEFSVSEFWELPTLCYESMEPGDFYRIPERQDIVLIYLGKETSLQFRVDVR